MAQHIGIVACSAEGAALCYRSICQGGAELLGSHEHTEISLHSLGDYMECIYRDDWWGVGELMLSSANKLAKIVADFLICPDNTIHQALPSVEQQLPLEWLHSRGGRCRGREPPISPPGINRNPLPGRQPRVSGKAQGAQAGVRAPQP
jgi:hypothetical protein